MEISSGSEALSSAPSSPLTAVEGVLRVWLRARSPVCPVGSFSDFRFRGFLSTCPSTAPALSVRALGASIAAFSRSWCGDANVPAVPVRGLRLALPSDGVFAFHSAWILSLAARHDARGEGSCWEQP